VSECVRTRVVCMCACVRARARERACVLRWRGRGRGRERERERVVVVVKTTDKQRSRSLLEAFFCCCSREASEGAVRIVKKQINIMMPITRTLEYPFPKNHLQKILITPAHAHDAWRFSKGLLIILLLIYYRDREGRGLFLKRTNSLSQRNDAVYFLCSKGRRGGERKRYVLPIICTEKNPRAPKRVRNARCAGGDRRSSAINMQLRHARRTQMSLYLREREQEIERASKREREREREKKSESESERQSERERARARERDFATQNFFLHRHKFLDNRNRENKKYV
jgi:hypothetical protein